MGPQAVTLAPRAVTQLQMPENALFSGIKERVMGIELLPAPWKPLWNGGLRHRQIRGQPLGQPLRSEKCAQISIRFHASAIFPSEYQNDYWQIIRLALNPPYLAKNQLCSNERFRRDSCQFYPVTKHIWEKHSFNSHQSNQKQTVTHFDSVSIKFTLFWMTSITSSRLFCPS